MALDFFVVISTFFFTSAFALEDPNSAYDPVNPAATAPQPGKPMVVAPFASGVIEVPNGPNKVAAAYIDPNYSMCGQDCIYGKAKEALSLQMQYVISKRQILDSFNLDSSTPSYDSRQQKAKLIVGKFCNDAESGYACKVRYTQLTDFWLLKARSSLGGADQMIYSLNSDKSQVGVVAQETLDGPPQPGKATNSTYVITVSDLYRLAGFPQAMATLNRIQTNDDWVQMLTQGDQKKSRTHALAR